MTKSLMPEHVVLSDYQAKRALKKIGVPYEKLPLIAYSDAAIQFLIRSGQSVSVGDVIRITRESLTAETYYYYRRVVS
jgi:DNA-directed RNA polymerase subunit H (RpoH/RPB5)